MADKTVKLTSPTGATVSVRAEKEEELLRRGFTAEKAPAKKAASSKSEK